MAAPRTDRKKRAARVLAIVLSICMVLTLMGYFFMIFANGTETAFVAVAYADSLEDHEDANTRYEGLSEIIEFIHSRYVDEKSYDELVNAAVKGVFDSLDPYSEYYFASKGVETITNALSSEYAGIGVTITSDNGAIRIVSVNPDGPSFEAGIKAQSLITKVDGKSVAGMTTNDVANILRGEVGTSVAVTVELNGVETTYTIVRRTLTVHSVSYEMLDGSIGYIKISDMAEKTAEEFADARVHVIAEGAKGIILDLRDNGGGYLDVAETISEMMLDSGTISTYVRQDKTLETVQASPDATKKLPMVVLTNGNTASASEMLTAALHDNGAAKTVGTTTFGKGVGQQVLQLTNGDSFKLSMLYFLTPNGVNFQGKGLAPDYVVYNSGTLTDAGRKYVEENVIPMALDQKYAAGQTGLNVLAAQQRLFLLGYELTPNGKMDAATVEALKGLQKEAGGKPYGGLDFFTLKALDAAYSQLTGADSTDAQLAKALELLQ